MNPKPVIIDCDTGTDDAIAIMAALFSPALDIRAFTTVVGNVALEHTSRNTLDLVRHLGFDTPVAVGAPKPILRDAIRYSGNNVHGKTGLGTSELPRSADPFHAKNAVETIYEAALACRGELELIPVGPLTNIALAVMAHPDLKGLIKQIVFMGGAKIGGNVTTTSEFNIWADPEAAKIVFAAGIPMVMVGLDVTTQAILNRDDAAHIRGMGSEAGRIAGELLDFMFDRFGAGGEDALMHDALAVGVCIDPTLVGTKPYFVDCECSGIYTSGHTFVAATRMFQQEPNCEVAETLDLVRFKKWLFEMYEKSK